MTVLLGIVFIILGLAFAVFLGLVLYKDKKTA